jgi:CDP-diacylglycerol--glycerol-3-phosphate 3-phosphatidyltransferase
MYYVFFPNALTVSRVLISALLVFLLSWPNETAPGLLAGLFAVGCLTDFLDGVLARRWQSVSGWGKVMDPLADKVLILSVLVMLTERALVPGWIAALFVVRELWVTGIRSKARMSASRLGKLKMFLQSLGLFLILLQRPGSLATIGLASLFGALAAGYGSMIDYMFRFRNDREFSSSQGDLCYTKDG